MTPNVLVYISGPMTAKDGRTIEQNTADGVAVYLDLLKRGIPAFSPHLSGAFPSAWTALSHAEWIAYDCAIIDRCTALLMMPRWETSTGARLEHDYATEKGVPIYYDTDALDRTIPTPPSILVGPDSAIRDNSDRIVAGPQPALPIRPPGIWDRNTDARGGGNDTGE